MCMSFYTFFIHSQKTLYLNILCCSILWVNSEFPASAGTNNKANQDLDFNKYCSLKFVTYLQVYEAHGNTTIAVVRELLPCVTYGIFKVVIISIVAPHVNVLKDISSSTRLFQCQMMLSIALYTYIGKIIESRNCLCRQKHLFGR